MFKAAAPEPAYFCVTKSTAAPDFNCASVKFLNSAPRFAAFPRVPSNVCASSRVALSRSWPVAADKSTAAVVKRCACSVVKPKLFARMKALLIASSLTPVIALNASE